MVGSSDMTRMVNNVAPRSSSLSLGKMITALRVNFLSLPPFKRNWLIASITFLLFLCILTGWYAQRPDWRVLFSGLDAKDIQQVSQQLSTSNIAYQISPNGGSIEVPSDSLDKARMDVAAKGMPQTGRLGFEIFDKPNWMGSEFDERVNYQRALEGELEQTISTLSAVRSARVHLVLPSPSLFTSEAKVAKASVVLKLRRSSVDSEEADAMRSLVAGAVENLNPDDVVLVDADGRVSLKPRSKNAAEGEIEQALETKVVNLLEPLAGCDNVRATVNLSYDQSTEERTDEIFDPSQVAAITLQRSEQNLNQPNKAAGIPGTASNTPAASPNGSVQGSPAVLGISPLLQKETPPVYPQTSSPGQVIKEESGTYAVTKHMVHSELEPGRLRRLTAAIVINDRDTVQGDGKSRHAVWTSRNSDEMRRMQTLAEASLGYDAKRGDQIVLENLSFSTNAQGTSLPLLDRAFEVLVDLSKAQPGLIRTITIGLCGALLILFVLQPAARQIAITLSAPALLETKQQHSSTILNSPTSPDKIQALAQQDDQQFLLQPGRSNAQVIFDRVSEHIRKEPTQSTRLLESWISSAEDYRSN